MVGEVAMTGTRHGKTNKEASQRMGSAQREGGDAVVPARKPQTLDTSSCFLSEVWSLHLSTNGRRFSPSQQAHAPLHFRVSTDLKSKNKHEVLTAFWNWWGNKDGEETFAEIIKELASWRQGEAHRCGEKSLWHTALDCRLPNVLP